MELDRLLSEAKLTYIMFVSIWKDLLSLPSNIHHVTHLCPIKVCVQFCFVVCAVLSVQKMSSLAGFIIHFK